MKQLFVGLCVMAAFLLASYAVGALMSPESPDAALGALALLGAVLGVVLAWAIGELVLLLWGGR